MGNLRWNAEAAEVINPLTPSNQNSFVHIQRHPESGLYEYVTGAGYGLYVLVGRVQIANGKHLTKIADSFTSLEDRIELPLLPPLTEVPPEPIHVRARAEEVVGTLTAKTKFLEFLSSKPTVNAIKVSYGRLFGNLIPCLLERRLRDLGYDFGVLAANGRGHRIKDYVMIAAH